MSYISTRQAFGLLGIWICFHAHHIVQTQKIQMLPEAENGRRQVIEQGSNLKLTCVQELGDEDDSDEEGSGSTLKLSPITKLDDNEDDEIFWTNDGINENNWEVIQQFHSCYLISCHHLILTVCLFSVNFSQW
jgi:hypothetical protein